MSLESLSAPEAATQVKFDPESGCVWLETDCGEYDGLVIGIGASRMEAMRDAVQELRDRLRDLEGALADAAVPDART